MILEACRPRVFLVGILFSLLVSACLPYKSQAFDPSKGSQIHTLALATPDPERYFVQSLGPGQDPNLGARRNDFDNALKSANFHLGAKIADALRTELQAHGYATVDTNVRADLDGNYAPSDVSRSDADALLGVQIGAAYQKNLLSFSYGPTSIVTVKLISTKTSETLFEQTYWYGPTDEAGRIMKPLVADSRYLFGSYEALMSDIPRASEGFAALAPLLAKTVTAEISK